MKKSQIILFSLSTSLCLSANVFCDVAVIINAKATLSNLDKDQVADIFLGKSNTFPDGSIAVPMALIEGLSARNDFCNAVIEKSDAQLKSYWSKMVFSGKGTPPKELSSNAEMIKLIADNPNMIGYADKASIGNQLVKIVFTTQ